jgi:cell division GTPase FtsZ
MVGGSDGVEFIVANTDLQAPGRSASIKIQIGNKLTKVWARRRSERRPSGGARRHRPDHSALDGADMIS